MNIKTRTKLKAASLLAVLVAATAFGYFYYLWQIGPSVPTEHYDFPVNNHGAIHYLNSNKVMFCWGTIFICVLVTFVSGLASGAFDKSE